ncbi:hypothetical protein QAD02_021828 [Eretmocerus hayati]|uniref:Uncharacterized protein n=1 Tax=Eretmocerus hayati TaxID=131215 RepID=A0ACC2PQZ4_9HYME|nr:hypothetical protein QAD02_021828 [Eretmocerus hayati]
MVTSESSSNSIFNVGMKPHRGGFSSKNLISVIISRFRRADYYIIILDDITVISLISKSTLILRYIYEGQIHKDFVKSVDLFRELRGSETASEERCYLELKVTELVLGSFVVKTLKDWDLVLGDCDGITPDSCSVNVSESRGAGVSVKNECKNASHSPCYYHMLDLSISKSSTIKHIRNSVGTMNENVTSCHASAKRNSELKNVWSHTSTGLFGTLWNERHEGVQQFRESLTEIVETLDRISL